MANQFLIKNTMADMRGLSVCEILSLQGTTPTYAGVELLGYYEKGDTPAPIRYYLSTTLNSDDGGSVLEVRGIKLEHKFVDEVDGEYFGVSTLNNAIANDGCIKKLILFAKSVKPISVCFPKGIIEYSKIDNLAKGSNGLTIKGYGPNQTILKYNGSGVAINMNAFEDSTPQTPFAKNITVEDINLLLSPECTVGLHLEGLARCIFRNIRVNGGNQTGTIGILNGAQLSHFYNLRSSYTDGVVPFIGMRTIASSRVLVSSNCSNNTFYDIQFEGNHTGVQLTRTDQNTFIGGTIEACLQRGLSISNVGGGRYNTFIGVGFESELADFDFIDTGTHTLFLGCYALRANLQGRMSKIMNGYYDLVQINYGATDNILENITYSHWRNEGFSHALVDGGQRTIKINTAECIKSQDDNTADIAVRDKNFGFFDGSVIADSFRTRVITDYKPTLVKADAYGGFVPFQNSISIDENIPLPGSGIAVNRKGSIDPSNDSGAWRLWTSSSNDLKLLFLKLGTGGNWTSLEVITNDNIATTTKKGLVNKLTACPDTATTPSITYTQSEVLAILTELRDLKTKLRSAGILTT